MGACERLGTAVSLLRQLQSDFRAVEESFREITLQVQQRQAECQDTRGWILEFALDAEDVLKQEDQGVSGDSFMSTAVQIRPPSVRSLRAFSKRPATPR